MKGVKKKKTIKNKQTKKLDYTLTQKNHTIMQEQTCHNKHIFKEPLSCFEPSGSAGLVCCRRPAC